MENYLFSEIETESEKIFNGLKKNNRREKQKIKGRSKSTIFNRNSRHIL